MGWNKGNASIEVGLNDLKLSPRNPLRIQEVLQGQMAIFLQTLKVIILQDADLRGLLVKIFNFNLEGLLVLSEARPSSLSG